MRSMQIIIVIVAIAVSALIIRHDLPIEFPWIIGKLVMLFLKLFIVLAMAAIGCVLTATKKKTVINKKDDTSA